MAGEPTELTIGRLREAVARLKAAEDLRPILAIPYWHPWPDEVWQTIYPSCRIVRAAKRLEDRTRGG